jgi:hypothetical protein
VLLALGGVATATPTEPFEVVRALAWVEGRVYTDLDIRRYVGRPLPGSATPRLSRATRNALVELVLQRLEVLEAERRGLEVRDHQVDAALHRRIREVGGPERFGRLVESSPATLADIRRDLRERMLIRRLYLRGPEATATPGRAPSPGRVLPREVRAHYLRHRGAFVERARRRVAIIELRGDAGRRRAPTLVAELRGGASFAERARAESRGPSADCGGDLGWIEPGVLDARVDAFVFAAAVGEVSEPLPTPAGGCWIVKILADRPARPLSYEQVQERIAADLRRERLIRLRRSTLARLVREASLHPAELREDLLEAAAMVGEPERP